MVTYAAHRRACAQGVRQLSKFAVTEAHKVPEGATSVSTKLQFELDLHGLVRCTAATHHHKVDVLEPPAEAAAAPADAEMAEAAAGEAAPPADGENGDAANMETDAAPAKEAEKPAPARKVKKARSKLPSRARASVALRARRGAVSERAPSVQISAAAKFEQQSLVSITPERYQQFLEEEGQMSASDALETATAEAKNNLEEYLLTLRSHLSDRYEAFATPETREALTRELTALEDWLYEDGEDEQKSVRRTHTRGRGTVPSR